MYTPERQQSSLDLYHESSFMDPLQLDEVFSALPSFNSSEDVATLSQILNSSVTKAYEADVTYSIPKSLAALRDLDFLASSYLRHRRDPIKDIAGLEGLLVELGNKAGTVPRGTVTTYALANPKGDRQRSFTGDYKESLFINAVRETSLVLEDSLQEFIHESPVAALAKFDQNLDVAIESIVSVMRAIPPEYFTTEMRPYFDPLTINGERYLGAGGAQLQFVAFDYILWGADESDPTYLRYFNENYDYLTPSQKSATKQILDKYDQNTLLQHIALNNDKEAATAAMGALKKMKKFRYPHRKLAQDNFKVRKPGQVGSGSYTTDILDVLLRKTEQAIEVAEGTINQ